MASLPLNRVSAYLTVAVFTTLIYSRWDGAYLDDDQMAILGVAAVTECTSISRLFDPKHMTSLLENDFWGVPLALNISHKSWRPLTSLTFRAGWCLHGEQTFWFHVVNTALHVVATLLFQYLCECIVFHSRVVPRLSTRRSMAWVAGILFGIHPVHVECVTNIVGRAEPLSAIMFFLSVLAFSCGRESSGVTSVFYSTFSTVTALSLCVLSMLAKEQGFSVVLVCAYFLTCVWSRLLPDLARKLSCNSIGSCALEHLPSTTTGLGDSQALFRLALLATGSVGIARWRLAQNQGDVTVFSAADNGAAFADHWLERGMTYAYYHWLQAVPLVWPQRLIHDMSFGTLSNVKSVWDARNGPSYGLYIALLIQGLYSMRVVFCQSPSNVQKHANLHRPRTHAQLMRTPTNGISVAQNESEPYSEHCTPPPGEDDDVHSTTVASNGLSRYAFHEILLSGLVLLILPFLPASNLLVTVGFTVAERVMYLPLMGFCVVVSLLGHALGDFAVEGYWLTKTTRKRAWWVILLAILSCFGTRAYMRTSDWDSELPLLDAGIRAYPTNAKLFANLAIAVYAYDDDRERSVKAADWALALKPDIHTAFSMRGLVHKDWGLFDQAEQDFRQAISIAPQSDMSARTNLGLVKIQQATAVLDAHGPIHAGTFSSAQSARELRASANNLSREEKLTIEGLITDAMKYAGADVRVLKFGGEMYLRIGKPEMALVYLRAANDIAPNNLIEQQMKHVASVLAK